MPTTFNVISLGNLADIDTTEGDNDAENASALVGMTFGGVNDALVNDFVSFSPGSGGFGGGSSLYYDQDNSPNENFSIDGGADQVFDSAARYYATITYTDGTTATVSVAVFQDTAGNTYLAPETSQNSTQDALEAGPIRSITLDSLHANTTSGLVADRDSFEFVTCYAPGVEIQTPSGPVAVEKLVAGDLVETLDHGPMPIRWVHRGHHPLEDALTDDKPVLIKAGALGTSIPAKDMIVSPQHRMFVGGGGQLQGWFKAECLAPAKSLTALRGIRHMNGKRRITWIHFACDRHAVVFANGCLSESLLLGPMVLNGLTRRQRRDLTAIYGPAPTPDAALNGPPARDCLEVGEMRRHLVKCIKQKGQRTAKEIQKWDGDLSKEFFEAELVGLQMPCGGKPKQRSVA